MLRILLAVLVVIIASLGGLYYYGSTLKPKTTPMEKVIPNDRFPS